MNSVFSSRLQILNWYKQHNNVNVMVARGDKKYVHTGRFQDEDQAIKVDKELHELLHYEGLPYTLLKPELDVINAFANSL